MLAVVDLTAGLPGSIPGRGGTPENPISATRNVTLKVDLSDPKTGEGTSLREEGKGKVEVVGEGAVVPDYQIAVVQVLIPISQKGSPCIHHGKPARRGKSKDKSRLSRGRRLGLMMIKGVVNYLVLVV